MEELIKILSSYRVTLPKDFRDKFGLKVGEHVRAIWDEGYLIIVPVELEVKARVKFAVERKV